MGQPGDHGASSFRFCVAIPLPLLSGLASGADQVDSPGGNPPWFLAAPDLQILDPAQQQTASVGIRARLSF